MAKRKKPPVIAQKEPPAPKARKRREQPAPPVVDEPESKTEGDPSGSGKKPNRLGEAQSFYLPTAHAEALRRYLASSRLAPSKTDIFILGVEKVLAEVGFWPLSSDP